MKTLIGPCTLVMLFAGCVPSSGDAASNAAPSGKGDTGYQTSGDAREVEVDLEADVRTNGDVEGAPLALGQFAMSWLRKTHRIYLQSLAEDEAGAARVEWRVGSSWIPASQAASLEASRLTHFRIRGLNAIVANGVGVEVGARFEPVLPLDPAAAGTPACDDGLDAADPHWYAWQPERAGCAEAIQHATLTVSRVMPAGGVTYPEYDRLIADGKLDMVVVFGQIGEELRLSEDDYALSEVDSFSAWLVANGFTAAEAEVGRRYQRSRGALDETVDVLGPREFAGLKDTGHYATFVRAFAEHEVIVYNGHSMLGQSAFFSQPGLYADPSKYQLLLYNGCLGYEYYVGPILAGKQGWDHIDIVANVVETWVGRHIPETAALLTGVMKGAENGGRVSWQDLLARANQLDGDEGFYGASGIRSNHFQPAAE